MNFDGTINLLYNMFCKKVFLLIFLNLSFILLQSQEGGYKDIAIIIGDSASSIERNIAVLLGDRLMENPNISVDYFCEKENFTQKSDVLLILLGIPRNHGLLTSKLKESRIPELNEMAPGREGFLLKYIEQGKGGNYLIAAGIDERGCLYAVGEILRQVGLKGYQLIFPKDLNIRTAPAYEIRGTQFGQSRVAKRLANVRDWTQGEVQRVILDYALAGANIFPTKDRSTFHFLKSYGLMTETSFGANTAGVEVPAAWNAFESIGRKGYVCLSVPEARKFMLNKCEDFFKNSPSFDLVKFHGGDGGGCECDRCNPYGLRFIELVEEMSEIIHKYHPKSRIYFTNQKFDNEDDNAIFDYLNKKPRTWLWAWGYGPGSDATTWQPGHRQTHRMDLFKYPGFGPYGLYPKEILRQIPPRHRLIYYNEITHWKYAQHAYIQMYPRADRNGDLPPHWSHDLYNRRPDQFLTMVYNRLTFFAWPKYYHRVFNDLMRYGDGDITHSSGHHDHFNQWMWQRLLWHPRMSVEEVVAEYCASWFGPEAAPLMAKAIFQLEKNMEEQIGIPLDKKQGIDNYYNLVQKAGKSIPPDGMEKDWLWKMYMQKGALDLYVKLDVTRQKMLQREIEEDVSLFLNGKVSIDIEDIIKKLKKPSETQEMANLWEEAKKLGEASNMIFGVRNDGYFNLQHDYIGLGWLERQLHRATSANKKESRRLLQMIIDYENPGEGGYYDNLGTGNKVPNVINGYPYDHGQPYVSNMLSEKNRPSQRSMHFTQNEDEGVTLFYTDLDPQASYTIRFTFVRPWYQERYADRMNQKSQYVYADGIALAKDVGLPQQMSDFFTYRIPKSLTKDGELTISLERAKDVARGDHISVEQWRNSGGWGTLASEVWLMKD